MFLQQGESLRDLRALEAISSQPTISQRDLARQLGVALGLANACLSKMARKGLIKISRINGRSLAYNVTPAGFTAKARLSVEYTKTTVGFYHAAKQAITDGLGVLAAQGISTVALVGANDMAEIVGIVCAHQGLVVVCIVDDDPQCQGGAFMGRTVLPLESLRKSACEAVIVTYLDDSQHWVERASEHVASSIPVMKAM